MLLLALFSGLLSSFLVSATTQTVGVRGELMCGDAPLANADVKLWLLRTFPPPGHEVGYSEDRRTWQIPAQVSSTDSSTIDPAVRFYHRCNNKGIFKIPESCQRESTYGIPKSYIAKSGKVDRWYEMGVMNMEDKQRGEQIHCTSNSTRAIRK